MNNKLNVHGVAKRVLWWGIGILVGGAVLIVLLPGIVSLIAGGEGLGQIAGVVIEVVLRVAREVLPPLGAALIGAGLVMAFIRRVDE